MRLRWPFFDRRRSSRAPSGITCAFRCGTTNVFFASISSIAATQNFFSHSTITRWRQSCSCGSNEFRCRCLELRSMRCGCCHSDARSSACFSFVQWLVDYCPPSCHAVCCRSLRHFLYSGIRYSAEAKPYGIDLVASLVMLLIVIKWQT